MNFFLLNKFFMLPWHASHSFTLYERKMIISTTNKSCNKQCVTLNCNQHQKDYVVYLVIFRGNMWDCLYWLLHLFGHHTSNSQERCREVPMANTVQASESYSHVPCGSCGPWGQMPRGPVVSQPHVPYEMIWTLCHASTRHGDTCERVCFFPYF